MRGATQGGPVLAVPERISIHAPHAGRDVILNPIPQEVALFQSTRPMRGATISLTLRRSAALYFNPRAPCGRDGLYGYSRYLLPEFQSTRPVRARLQLRQELHAAKQISIHAPRAGATLQKPTSYFHITISIHAPRAGATKSGSPPCYTDSIAIHAPRAGATEAIKTFHEHGYISIHAPRAGATRRIDGVYRRVYISIHAPRAGATRDHTLHGRIRANFNPRAPCGRDPVPVDPVLAELQFQSTRPVRARLTGNRYLSMDEIFQSTRPVRARQYTKLFYTLLRQKAIFRQFHAKRRLLKRFSTYKYRNTFLICSANRMGKICTLPLRTTRSLDLPEGMSACSQSARFCFRTFFPSSKTADYPAPDP